MQLEKPKKWDLLVNITTDKWKILIKLFETFTPKTTANFIELSKKWYYNNTIFHRVIKWFMIQWWDPTWSWYWWESIYWNVFEDEFCKDLSNIKWSISMANSWPNTNWSQFFINLVDNTYLDYWHTVFGQVIEWMENVLSIASCKTNSEDKPVKDIKIIKIEVKFS